MKTALVVDDEPFLRRQVMEVLASYGFERVIEAADGARAVDLVEREKPLLVVMDVQMPVMDGITAAEKIGITCPTPIVLLTGTDDIETVGRAREAGVMSYLLKPFRSADLPPAVDLAIHQFISLNELRHEVAELKQALETRKLIEKAKGVFIAQGLSEPEAYRKMQKLAMDKRKTLKEVAEAVLLMAG